MRLLLFQHLISDMPLTYQFSPSPRKIPNSSDTEQLVTPPRKRFRESDEDSDSFSSPNTPRKRRMLLCLGYKLGV